MTSFIARRLAWAAFVVVTVMSGVFFMMNAVGDPAAATLGPRAGAEQLAAYRRTHGLDQPLSDQYIRYMSKLLRGDLGESFRDGQPVTDVVLSRLPRTALLGLMAMAFELCIGLVIGIVTAARRNTWLDTGFMATAFIGISAPTFLTGLLGIYYIAFRLGWFPVGGYGVDLLDHARHAVLPALTLAVIGAATYARVMRSEMIETLRQDFVRTAHAKGVGPVRALLAHGARNALLPMVTLVGMHMANLVSGAIITESIYGWPGMGRLAFEAITALDVPLVMGVVLVASLTVQAGNLLADLAVAALDPRVRLEGRGR